MKKNKTGKCNKCQELLLQIREQKKEIKHLKACYQSWKRGYYDLQAQIYNLKKPKDG